MQIEVLRPSCSKMIRQLHSEAVVVLSEAIKEAEQTQRTLDEGVSGKLGMHALLEGLVVIAEAIIKQVRTAGTEEEQKFSILSISEANMTHPGSLH
jgi:hypothetical protein